MDMTLKLPFLGSNKEPATPFLGGDRQLLTDQLHGDFYESNRRNRLFIASSATGGIAIIVAATTGGHPTLFNPLGSGRMISIRRLHLGLVSGTNAPGALAWNSVVNAGANIGPAGAAILTATRVDVVSAVAGGAVDSKAYWSPTTNTFTAAPVFYRTTSLSLLSGTVAAVVAPYTLGEEYDGDFLVKPGTAVCLVDVAATTTSLYRVSIVFEEIDE